MLSYTRLQLGPVLMKFQISKWASCKSVCCARYR